MLYRTIKYFVGYPSPKPTAEETRNERVTKMLTELHTQSDEWLSSIPPKTALLTLKQAFDVLQSTYTPTGELRKEPELKIYVVAPQRYNKVRLLGGGESWGAGEDYGGGDVDECWDTYGYNPVRWRKEFRNRKQVGCFHGLKYGSTYFASTDAFWWVVNDTLEQWLLERTKKPRPTQQKKT